SILQGVKLFTPRKYQKFILNFLQEAKIKVGYWLRGQLLIMIIIGLLDYLALLILGVPFALLLGVLGGILEIVPYLGPNLAALPAVLLAFSISPALAALVILAYFLIQQFEADFLTPKVMQKVAGLNPIISIVAIMVGYKLLGIAGGLLAIPTTVLLILFIKHWLAFRNKI
ncbi:AI-2E family transporter, partial [Candidatus Parcubacteria bacterium]